MALTTILAFTAFGRTLDLTVIVNELSKRGLDNAKVQS